MKFLIDDANIERIKELYSYYPIDGVTTNPSILAKYGEHKHLPIQDAVNDSRLIHMKPDRPFDQLFFHF